MIPSLFPTILRIAVPVRGKTNRKRTKKNKNKNKKEKKKKHTDRTQTKLNAPRDRYNEKTLPQ